MPRAASPISSSPSAPISKAMMPKAVDVPEELQQSAVATSKKAKKIVDRVPLLETASYTPETQTASLDQNKGVTIDEVPAIPAPVKAKTKASLDTYAMAQAPSNSALAAR